MRRFYIIMFFMVTFGSVLFAQVIRSEPGQVYRFIHSTADERAGDVRWIEIWETHTQAGDFEWTLIDSEWSNTGIESKCYYAVAIGNGVPLYMEDGEIRAINTRDELLDELENRRLVLNSEFYMDELECKNSTNAIINGTPATSCVFENKDASGLFLVKPPATSIGELWTADDGGYTLRYDFSADGSTGDVTHRYEFMPNANISIKQPEVSDLLCLDDKFPLPFNTEPISPGSLTFMALQSDLDVSELQTFYDNALSGEWIASMNRPNGGRVFTRRLDDETLCTLEMRYRENPMGPTSIAVSVYPSEVNLENLEVTADFASPIVVQSYYSIAYKDTGTIAEIVARQVTQQGEDWYIREDLTDIREDSAFVVLAQEGSQQEIYITVDRINTEESSVNIQSRPGICGSTFNVNS